jgi:hypothetical protein
MNKHTLLYKFIYLLKRVHSLRQHGTRAYLFVVFRPRVENDEQEQKFRSPAILNFSWIVVRLYGEQRSTIKMESTMLPQAK